MTTVPNGVCGHCDGSGMVQSSSSQLPVWCTDCSGRGGGSSIALAAYRSKQRLLSVSDRPIAADLNAIDQFVGVTLPYIQGTLATCGILRQTMKNEDTGEILDETDMLAIEIKVLVDPRVFANTSVSALMPTSAQTATDALMKGFGGAGLRMLFRPEMLTPDARAALGIPDPLPVLSLDGRSTLPELIDADR